MSILSAQFCSLDILFLSKRNQCISGLCLGRKYISVEHPSISDSKEYINATKDNVKRTQEPPSKGSHCLSMEQLELKQNTNFSVFKCMKYVGIHELRIILKKINWLPFQ